jgi:hypothetical protein
MGEDIPTPEDMASATRRLLDAQEQVTHERANAEDAASALRQAERKLANARDEFQRLGELVYKATK